MQQQQRPCRSWWIAPLQQLHTQRACSQTRLRQRWVRTVGQLTGHVRACEGMFASISLVICNCSWVPLSMMRVNQPCNIMYGCVSAAL
jgi:hypothetical protein